MVISGIYVETIGGRACKVARKLEELEGVEVHHIEAGFKIIIILEADTIDASYDLGEKVRKIDDVLTFCLVYTNFEEEDIPAKAAVSR